MNDLTIQSVFETMSMTSREIAKLHNKKHKSILRDIREMIIDRHNFVPIESTFLDVGGREQPMFILGAREVFAFISQKYPESSDAIFDRLVANEQKIIASENAKIKALENDLTVCLLQNETSFEKDLELQELWSFAAEHGLLTKEPVIIKSVWRVTPSSLHRGPILVSG